MAIQIAEKGTTGEERLRELTNGASLAAFAAAGVGSFTMGLVVLLNEHGLFSAPVLYAPAGGVSTRTTLALAVWLLAWILLHLLWKGRSIDARAVAFTTLILVALGILGTFPPLWALL